MDPARAVCLGIRVTAIFLLLATFGIALSLPLAIMFICAGAASAAIPIGPAGVATQITAGTMLLAAVAWRTSMHA